MSSDRGRLTVALVISLLLHALLLGLTFGDELLGLPGFSLPWKERRAEARDLRVVLMPARAAAAEPAVALDSSVQERLQQAVVEQTVGGGLALKPSVPSEPIVSRPAEVIALQSEAPPTTQAEPVREVATAAVAAKAPARVEVPAEPSPAPIPVPPVIAVEKSADPTFVVPVAPPTPVVPVVPATVGTEPEVRERVVEAAKPDPALREAELQRQRQADQLEAARVEAAKVEAARQEAARAEAAKQEAERLKAEREAARVAAAKLEAQRQEIARAEAARVEAARVAAARLETQRQEAARVAAAQAEAQRQEATREAARVEAARLEAQRQEAARQAAAKAEAQRQEAARAESARLEAERQDAARQESVRQANAKLEAQRQEAARAEAARQEAARQVTAQQEAARQAAAQKEAARIQAEKDEDAKRQARREAMGRQLNEEAERRKAADTAASTARPQSTLPYSYSTARRGRLWGRTDANAELVLYAEALARRIQFNTPVETVRDVAKRPHINPLVTVAIRSDGSVESVTFVTSSGVPEVDEAIRRIIQSHAIYPPFTPALAREYDVVEVRRTWHFDTAVRLY
jgi:outer membrane biosynthesis protein TonB